MFISDENCEKLAQRIKNDFFEPVSNFKTFVFLCGADLRNPNSIRAKLASTLNEKWYSFYFDLIYPEDIFEELLSGPNSKNLLTLENLLADSVDAVVIIPESPGSLTELGAFVNSRRLSQKVVCVIEKKYQKDKSFINLGPVKIIKGISKDRVLYIDPASMNKEVDRLRTVLTRMKKQDSKLETDLNLIQIDNFLLPAIYLLEPVEKKTLMRIVSSLSSGQDRSYALVSTAITSLTKKRLIEANDGNYALTKLGLESFLRLKRTNSRTKIQQNLSRLDELRLEIFNFRLRNRKLKV